jgi:poly-beta-1,6-N-acetyl-D-glucosamine synthase
MKLRTYVLMTAARNEEKDIERTILSVVSQTIKPSKWVIVSDGSTDQTDEIVARYAAKYDFIELLCIKGDNTRNFGSQVRAINIGYEQMKNAAYEYIGNLDADISFEEDYYERILQKYDDDPRLGLTSGYIYEQSNGTFISREFNNINSVPHAVQLFRRKCFEDIGGYMALPYGGPDWVAEVTARMKGWHVMSIPEIVVYHHRPTASAGGILKNRFRLGLLDYSVGSHPVFEVIKDTRRMIQEPYLIGGLIRLCGYIWGYVRNEKRMVSDEFVEYLRKEQMDRVFRLCSPSKNRG